MKRGVGGDVGGEGKLTAAKVRKSRSQCLGPRQAHRCSVVGRFSFHLGTIDGVRGNRLRAGDGAWVGFEVSPFLCDGPATQIRSRRVLRKDCGVVRIAAQSEPGKWGGKAGVEVWCL
jgi:hypothetical protein